MSFVSDVPLFFTVANFVSLIILDLTWSAVANNPDHNCNPGLAGIISGDKTKVSFDKTSIVGLVIWMFCILYSSLRSANAVSALSAPDPERQGSLKFFLHAFYSVSSLLSK